MIATQVKQKKTFIYLLLSALILLSGYLTYAQFTDNEDAYQVQTVHIFPAHIDAPRWNNAETVTFQNVSEYSLFQEFNRINSATIKRDNATEIEVNRAKRNEDAVDGDENSTDSTADVDIATGSAATDTNQAVASDTAEVSPESTDSSATSSTATVEFGFGDESVTSENTPQTESAPVTAATTAPTVDVPADEVETLSEPAEPSPPDSPATSAEDVEPVDAGTTTVLQRVGGFFRLAAATVTEFIGGSATSSDDSSEATLPSKTDEDSESAPTTAAATNTEPSPDTVGDISDTEVATSTDPEALVTAPATNSATSSTATTEPLQPRPAPTNATSTTATTTTPSAGTDRSATSSVTDSEAVVVTTSTTAPTTSTETPDTAPEISDTLELNDTESEVESSFTAPENSCGADCPDYVISLANFGFPLDPGVEISGAHLRLSMAAAPQPTRDVAPEIEIWYSRNGGHQWERGGTIIVDEEISNSVNGGYYLFALPRISSQTALEDLVVEIRYSGDPDDLAHLYIESAWLELFTLEPPSVEAPSDYLSILQDNGYREEPLSGDRLVLPDGDVITFDFTDENSDETLIIKSDDVTYEGVTRAQTYFSVTNISDDADDITVQTYFPENKGEVTNLQVFNPNRPRTVTVPEYRPFVFHCEAGWEYVGEVPTDSLTDLSRTIAPAVEAANQAREAAVELDSEPEATVESTPQAPLEEEDTPTEIADTATSGVEFALPDSSATSAPDGREVEVPTATTANTTTAVWRSGSSLYRLLQAGTTTDTEAALATTTTQNNDTASVADAAGAPSVDEGAESAAADSEFETDAVDTDAEGLVPAYTCRNTNVIRECDSITGDNTACRIEQMKVAEHEVIQYAPGWETRTKEAGEMPRPGILRRAAEFIGFGPDRKEVPEEFEVRTHTPDTYHIRPGETLYFKMDISFPPFSTGEYWVEAIGRREYGLLDPFWSSQWRYRKPITITNPSGEVLPEQQVYVELDSAATGFWTNVQTDGDDIRFIREQASDQIWYDAAWSNRVPITIQASQVDDDLTNFPVYVDLADLGSGFFSEVASDGADIRITDEAGTTEFAYDLVDIDTGLETGQLHFLASTTISSTTDTTFYLYFGNDAATAYGPTDPLGSQAVWANDYLAVYHLEEDAAGRSNANLYQDSTSNNYDADDELNSTGKTGLLGQGQEVDAQGDPNEYILLPSDIVTGETQLYFSYWMNSTEPSDQALINGGPNNEYLIFLTSGGNNLVLYDDGANDNVALGTDLSNGTWRHVVVTRDTGAGQWRVFIDGSQVGTASEAMSPLVTPANCLVIGLEQDGPCLNSGSTAQHLNALIDEMRFRSSIPSDAYIAATYENQASTTNFYSVGAGEVQEFGTFVELDYWVQHFDYANQEADIWVQIDEIPDTATSSIYLYYGNADATSLSDEFAPFTYSTSTELYFVLNEQQSTALAIYSYIDNNEIWIDGVSLGTVNAGGVVSTTTYSSSSVISALGPITARTTDNGAEPPVPISFASTTIIVPSSRATEDFYVRAPFTTATVNVFDGAAGTPENTATATVGTVELINANIGAAGILEASEPIVVFHNGNGNEDDSIVAYPPTTRDLFGKYSQDYLLATAVAGSSTVDIFCSSGIAGSDTSLDRGELGGDIICASGGNGAGDAVRLATASSAIAAIQQRDGNGVESSVFLPEPEFGTEYIFPQAADNIAVVCSPRFGTSTVELQSAGGGVLEVATDCGAGGEYPGTVLFNSSTYAAGSRIVSTNDVPFFVYYEYSQDETNTWGAVQGKRFRALDLRLEIGAEEENEDAQYEQLNYRWYENNDAITPSTAWPSELGTVAEGEAITGQSAVNAGDQLRLRMNLLANNGTGTVDSSAFLLQYAEAETCSTVSDSAWRELGDIGSTTAAFAGYGTPVGDGATLPSALLSNSDVTATFEEENFTNTLPNEVGNGEAVEFDWSITPVSGVVVANSQYCFRMIRSTDVQLTTYTSYPQLLTAGPPETPLQFERFNNEHATSLRPTLEFSATDIGGDELNYEIEVDTDPSFGSPLISDDSDGNFAFTNVQVPADTAPFNNGQRVRYTPLSDLTNGQTYWWRVRAIDPDGSNTYGSWSESYSFTINTSLTVSEWFQTTDEQFETNTLTSATTSGSGSIESDLGGSTLLGEYGSLTIDTGVTTTVSLNNSYTNPVVVTSGRYPRSIANGDQPITRVFNKGAGSFDVLAYTFDFTSVGSTTVDYVVMEAGDYLMDDGSDGLRVFATSTNVSAIAGNPIPNDPSTVDITFPTSFSNTPVVLAAVTTINDSQWVVPTVYDGNDIQNPPSASQISLYLNDSLAADGHGSAEDIDIIAFDPGSGSNDGVNFAAQNTAVDVTHVPIGKTFSNTYSGVPGVILVQQQTMNGAQGGYAMVDTDTPPTNATVTVAFDEGGTSGGRDHAPESLSIVSFEGGSGNILRAGNAQVVSTPIDFTDADVGNAWGEVGWNGSGDLTIRVQYQTGSGFQNIPDSALPGNSAGFTSSPINILSLDTASYSQLRLTAGLSGVNPELTDWRVTWGQRVEIPELGDPFDNQKLADTTPLFDFISSDPESDDLEYEISISTDPTFQTSSTTINSTASSSDFANLDSGGDTNPFNSGDRISYQLPIGLALTDTETYWWRVRARDPGGSNAWSPWSPADNFTVDTSTIVSSWFQTTQAQFFEGVLDGAVASTTNSVEIGVEIGEYGTTTVTGNDWSTINTQLTYNNMVVVAKPTFAYDSGADNHRVVQVRNKTSDSFEVKAENESLSLSGVTDIHYIVMEAGDWTIVDGDAGFRIIAGTEADVSEVEGGVTGYDGGRRINFTPNFTDTTPAAISTVSTANGGDWVATIIDDGTDNGFIDETGMNVALHISLDTNTSRTPEDIDYIAFETATGTNNSVLFETLNSADNVTGGITAVPFGQAFTVPPEVILTQTNAMDGNDGGISIIDQSTPTTNLTTYAVITEIPVNGGHAAEVVSLIAFETAGGVIERENSIGGGLIGSIASEEVLFSDGVGPKFERALFGATEPGNSTTSLQIQYQTATGSWALVPDSQVPGNSVGVAGGVVDLTNVNIVTYPVIRLLASLQCDSTDCPTLDDWTVEWSEGVSLTGNLKQYDRLTNVANATVTAAVNGVPTTRTDVTDVNGNFSLSNVTAFTGDTVTVYVDGVPDNEEAVGVFVYDGLGDMTGVQLYEQHLTLASDELATSTLATLAASDNSAIGDEDVFFEVNASGDLVVCATGSCADANLYVGAGNVFIPSDSLSESITTHDFINDGRVELDNNTLTVSGSWENAGTVVPDTSSVFFTASSGSELLSDMSGMLTFNNLTFGSGSGNATFAPADDLVVNGNLNVAYGTLARGTLPVTVSGSLSTGVGGFWSGIGTTTFAGSGSGNWTNTNPILQNVGRVVIDGTPRSVTVGSDVRAESIFIGDNDTLNAGGANEIQVAGNFTNSNTFVPLSSTLTVVGTGTTAVITTGGDNLHNFRASTTGGGVVSFTEPTVTVLNDVTIATGTVTFPATELTIGGSLLNTGGNFAHNNALVRFTSGNSENIELQGTAFLNHFYDVSFTGSGAWTFLDTNATTSNTWTQSNGSVTFPSGQLTITRDFTTSGAGSFDANGGEVLFLARSTDSIVANGSDFHDVRIQAGDPVRGGSYDSSFLYRDLITIDASNIDDDLTEFPVYLNLADFAPEFFDNIRSDGGDIRITTADGVTEVPREIVTVDTSGNTGEVYFQAPTLSSTTNTTFYVYYGSSTATDYADNATFGAQNVWDDDYLAVYHMESEDAVDSTSFNRDATAVGSLTTTSGRVGTAVDITDTGGDDYINLNSNLSELNGLSQVTISTWVNVDEDSGDDVLFATQNGNPILLWDNISGTTNNDTYTFSVDSTGTGNRVDAAPTGISVGNTWQYVTASMNADVRNIYVDGSLANTRSGSAATIPTNTGGSNIGRWQGTFDYGGLVDEFRISRIERSAEWIAAEYRNMATSSDFYTVSNGAGITSRTFTDSNVTLTGDMVIESASAVFPSNVLSIGGSFDNNSLFTSGSGVVSFTATSGVHTVAAGSSTFHTLRFNDTGGSITVTENATATNAIQLQATNDFTLASGVNLTTLGTFSNTTDGASTTWDGTLRLAGGSDYGVNGKTDSGDVYGTVEVTGDGDIAWWNSRATSYSLLSSSSIYSQDHDGVDGDLYIFGDYVRESGTEYWRYDRDFDGATLAGTSTRQVNVRISNGSRVVASTSDWEIIGSSTASTTIDAVSGGYTLIGQTASLTAQYATLAGTDADGLQLLASTTVTSFSNLELTSSVTSALTVDASTVDTNPNAQYFNVDYVNGGGGVNVTLTGSPTNFWWFRDGAGNLYGENFDADGFNPGQIRWDDSNLTITVSGTVFSDNGITGMTAPTCNGIDQNVRIVVGGGTYTDSTTCAPGGAYSFSGVSYQGDPTIVVYLDTDGGEQGSVITRTPTADIDDLNVYANRVMTRHEDAFPMTIARMAVYDESDDTDLRYVAATGTPDTLIVRPDTSLMVASSTTFVPGGNITLESSGSGNTFDGTLQLDDDATFTAASGQNHSVGGSLVVDGGAAFTAASSTFTFTATTTGKNITRTDPTPLTFNDLQFTGVGGEWSATADLVVTGDLTVATGTLTGAGDITLPSGTFGGDGTVDMTGGEVTIEGTTTLGGVRGWTFNDLTLGTTATTGTTTRSDVATTTITGVLTIVAGHFLETGSSNWDLRGAGNVLVEAGTLLQDTSTFTYNGAGATVLGTTYYNLRLASESGSQTYAFGPIGTLVENNLAIGGGSGDAVASIAVNDPVVEVQGDVLIAGNGELVASAATPLTLLGSFDNNGTFTGSGGLVEFAGTGPFTIAAGASSFSDVLVRGAGAATVSEHATATGVFTLATSSDFTVSSGQSLAVGTEFQNLAGGAATDWTGSTLVLFGGAYTVNASTTNDSYDTLVVSNGAQVRLWNSSASTTIAEAGSGLYSQDHAGSNGLLQIYGDFSESSLNDYWSYETDFDGTDLTGGNERAVSVRVEPAGSVTYSGGSLSIIGTSTASTSVAVLGGTGDYSFDVGGTAQFELEYFDVADLDADGLTFTGAPDVLGMDRGRWTIDADGSQAMNISGATIDANPALNLVAHEFRTIGGVTTAFNASTTGDTVSSWRFTTHTGDIDGESFDRDNGDPGYLVWDDSTPVISISGRVYESNRSTVSNVCDGSTTNIVLAVEGIVTPAASSSCNGTTGQFTISGVSFSPNDSLILFINNEAGVSGATVSIDPISTVGNMDIYEDHVIVRQEASDPTTIADLADYDGNDDGDIPYVTTASPDTLTVDPDTTLLVWTNKEFAPAGDITTGGGAGNTLDGTVELLSGAVLTLANGESHSFGGDLTLDPTATFVSAESSVDFTSAGSGRTVDTNEAGFFDVTFSGAGSFSTADTALTVGNDLTIAGAALTLPAATTTIGGSLSTAAGSFDANGGLLRFTSSAAGETISTNGSPFAALTFSGSGAWTMSDTNATATSDVRVESGALTLPGGVFAIGGDFENTGSLTAAGGTLDLTNAVGTTTLTVGGATLGSVRVSGGATTTLTDASAALSGDLTIAAGGFITGSGTLSIGGSFDATGGQFVAPTGTVLFNSSDIGESVNPGANVFHNLTFAGSGGGWTLASATTTNNFTVSVGNSFTLTSGATLVVDGVFTNTLGGAATTWENTTVRLRNTEGYSINTKNATGDAYDTLEIETADIRVWNSVATNTVVSAPASLYSQDHAASNGLLHIYGAFDIATTSEFWSHARDFDGAALTGGNVRPVTVRHASSATTTVSGSGSLDIVGAAGATTTVAAIGSGSYGLRVEGGTIDFEYYTLRDLPSEGLVLTGTPNISSLSYGRHELRIDQGTLITLASTTLNANPSLLIEGSEFQIFSPALDGTNVSLDATSTNSWVYRNHSGNLDGESFDSDGEVSNNCGSIRWDNSSCLLTEQTEYRWRDNTGGLGVPSSEWLDSSFTRRKRVRVVNPDPASYTNPAVLTTITYDSDMQADFDDLRFTAADGVTPVDFWIERKTNSVSADLWLEVPSIGGDSTETFFMYYGSSTAASESDIDATFVAGDDFEDNNISEYSGLVSDFQVTSVRRYGGTYSLTAQTPASFSDGGMARFDQTIGQGNIIRWRQYLNPASSADELCVLFAVQSALTIDDNYGVCLEQFGTDRLSLAEGVTRNDTHPFANPSVPRIIASTTVNYTAAGTGWYEVVIDWETGGDITVDLFGPSGSLVASVSANDTTYTSGGYGFTFWNNNGNWDNFLAWPRTNSSLTTLIGVEQTEGGSDWVAPQSVPTSAFTQGEIARLRVAIENTGLDITNQEFQLEYTGRGTTTSCAAVPATSFAPVPNDATCGSNAICMATSSVISNGAATVDLLDISDNAFSAGAFVESPSSRTGPIDVNQFFYTELEYAIRLTENAVDDSYCFRLTDDGTAFDSYTNIPELQISFAPVVTNVTLNEGFDISLIGGTTTAVTATATVTDLNGVADLEVATTTFYRSGVAGGASCAPDDNNCYRVSAPQCSFIECDGVNTCTVSCTADFQFFTDSTDSEGAFDGEEWFAFVEVEDFGGGYGFSTNPIGVEVLTVRAADVIGAIDYGTLAVNQDTGSFNASTSIVNLGNVPIDIEVEGTDLTDGFSSAIPAERQRFATSTFTYSTCGGSCAVVSSTVPVPIDLELSKPSAPTPPVSDQIYWGIAVPVGINSAPHQGTNTFFPVPI